MKMIKIENCNNCPLNDYQGDSPDTFMIFCTHRSTYGIKIDDMTTLPIWCALDDFEEVV